MYIVYAHMSTVVRVPICLTWYSPQADIAALNKELPGVKTPSSDILF